MESLTGAKMQQRANKTPPTHKLHLNLCAFLHRDTQMPTSRTQWTVRRGERGLCHLLHSVIGCPECCWASRHTSVSFTKRCHCSPTQQKHKTLLKSTYRNISTGEASAYMLGSTKALADEQPGTAFTTQVKNNWGKISSKPIPTGYLHSNTCITTALTHQLCRCRPLLGAWVCVQINWAGGEKWVFLSPKWKPSLKVHSGAGNPASGCAIRVSGLSSSLRRSLHCPPAATRSVSPFSWSPPTLPSLAVTSEGSLRHVEDFTSVTFCLLIQQQGSLPATHTDSPFCSLLTCCTWTQHHTFQTMHSLLRHKGSHVRNLTDKNKRLSWSNFRDKDKSSS